MPKGHRRTQSSTITCGPTEDTPAFLQRQIPISSNQIAALLARSEERIQEKVSSVESLNVQTYPDGALFNFGRASGRKNEEGPKKYLREEYMMSIPERKEGPENEKKRENAFLGSNPFARKGRNGIGAVQIDSMVERTPFSNTLNLCSPTRFKRTIKWRETDNRRQTRLFNWNDKRIY